MTQELTTYYVVYRRPAVDVGDPLPGEMTGSMAAILDVTLCRHHWYQFAHYMGRQFCNSSELNIPEMDDSCNACHPTMDRGLFQIIAERVLGFRPIPEAVTELLGVAT